MFLTRAAQIIGKEGFKTFGYALHQKMHQNMTDVKAYGNYQKNIAPKQRITDNKADCVEICSHCENYESLMAEVSGMNAEYIAVCDENCEFDKEFAGIVSHYIRTQKRLGEILAMYTQIQNNMIRKLDVCFQIVSPIIHGIRCCLIIILEMLLQPKRIC